MEKFNRLNVNLNNQGQGGKIVSADSYQEDVQAFLAKALNGVPKVGISEAFEPSKYSFDIEKEERTKEIEKKILESTLSIEKAYDYMKYNIHIIKEGSSDQVEKSQDLLDIYIMSTTLIKEYQALREKSEWLYTVLEKVENQEEFFNITFELGAILVEKRSHYEKFKKCHNFLTHLSQVYRKDVVDFSNKDAIKFAIRRITVFEKVAEHLLSCNNY